MIKVHYHCQLTHPPTKFTLVKLKRHQSFAVHVESKLICIIEKDQQQWKKYGGEMLTDLIFHDLCHYLDRHEDTLHQDT